MARSAVNWRKHIKLHESSGLSIAAYCRKAKVSASRFYYHREMLEKSGKAPENTDMGEFLPVVVAGKADRANMRICFSGGVKLEFDEDVHPAKLAAIIKAMRK